MSSYNSSRGREISTELLGKVAAERSAKRVPAAPADSTAATGFINKHIFHRERVYVGNPRPVAALNIYRKDAVVGRTLTWRQSKRVGGGIRSAVSSFSRAARRRMAFIFRNMEPPKIMLTLTYPSVYSSDGKRVKRDLDAFKKFLARRGVRAVAWFLEFQERGAPHFHIFLWYPVSKDAISSAWYRIVGSGDGRHLRAGTKVEWLRLKHAAAAYASKYALKSGQKEVPAKYSNVGRFWGVSRSVRPKPVLSLSGVGVYSPITALGENIFTAIRVLRRLYIARRRKFGSVRRFRDRGYGTMTLYGCGACAL